MLKKRIIPCLDIKDGRVVKGVNFVALADAGDPVGLASYYAREQADELVFLDISATIEGRKTLIALVEKIAVEIDIPFTVGGGINSVAEAGKLIKAGADKISVNSGALKRPELISELADAFGSQAITVAVDVKTVGGNSCVFSHGGSKQTGWDAMGWCKRVEQLGAGEILLTSMDRDGTRSGFSIAITDAISRNVSIPVIASGGAGDEQDFADVFLKTRATGALAAGIFHYGDLRIPDLKNYLRTKNIPIR
ncbi:MAG: imidazole glycerol phosphate synthase subunit HisF [Flavobacterium sp.]|uniref:imidazole glycerol phosphate synthase subunit HisF n=1 Tax=Flavobacterium sp. TaxID=239 RepID=UPI001218D578|nr:imidazole glycerol phosphate synthase subunit HisF [Flavobacterium sp.]RZJ66239.1 MAG: imidazole glycerol phosphate synthase subunit HisF [Flavobacterium sp.]